MYRLALASLAAAALLFGACSGDGDKPNADDPESREAALREAVEAAFAAFRDGDVDEFYSYFSSDFQDRCDEEDFRGLMAIARIFIGSIGEDEGDFEVVDVTFEDDDSAVVETMFESGDDESSFIGSGASDEDDFLYTWTLEDGEWKTDTAQDDPCDLSFDSGNGDGDDDDTPEATGPGTSREEAVPLGETVLVGDLEVTAMRVNLDATEVLLADNEFNEPPIAGNRYVLINLRARHGGSGSDTIEISTGDFKLTGSRNVLYDGYGDASCGFIDGEIRGEMFPGGEVEGTACFQVPADETDLILVVEPFFSFEDGDRRYIALE